MSKHLTPGHFRFVNVEKAEPAPFGMIPQVLPAILGNMLYYFGSITRPPIRFGIGGASGMARDRSHRVRVNKWDDFAFIVMKFITVAIIDYLPKPLRRRVIGAGDQPAGMLS